eukprot:PhM_4_TR16168/c3_g1_i3/m.24472
MDSECLKASDASDRSPESCCTFDSRSCMLLWDASETVSAAPSSSRALRCRRRSSFLSRSFSVFMRSRSVSADTFASSASRFSDSSSRTRLLAVSSCFFARSARSRSRPSSSVRLSFSSRVASRSASRARMVRLGDCGVGSGGFMGDASGIGRVASSSSNSPTRVLSCSARLRTPSISFWRAASRSVADSISASRASISALSASMSVFLFETSASSLRRRFWASRSSFSLSRSTSARRSVRSLWDFRRLLCSVPGTICWRSFSNSRTRWVSASTSPVSVSISPFARVRDDSLSLHSLCRRLLSPASFSFSTSSWFA